jgi:hypothetical protein
MSKQEIIDIIEIWFLESFYNKSLSSEAWSIIQPSKALLIEKINAIEETESIIENIKIKSDEKSEEE